MEINFILAFAGALFLTVCLGGLVFVAIKTTKKNADEATTQAAAGPPRRAGQRGQADGRRAPGPEGAPVPAPPQRGAGARLRAAALRRRAQAEAEAAAAAQDGAEPAERSGSDGGSDEDEGQIQQQGAAGQRDIRPKSRREQYEEQRRKKDEAREAKEKAEEEAKAAAERERQRLEDEEASKWMSLISVEQEGSGEADEAAEETSMLGQFVEYIKTSKSVALETIALEFGLRTSDVIERVRNLEEMGRLTGVMDERGKYIYISPDEMKAFADYIASKGRVAISHLASHSSSLLDLENKAAAISANVTPAIDFDDVLGVHQEGVVSAS